jgi:HK97 family phage portal protein
MNIIDRLFSKAINRAVQQQVSAQWMGINNFVGWANTVYHDSTVEDILEQGYSGNANVYAAAHLLIAKAASIPANVYKVKDKQAAKQLKSITGGAMSAGAIQKAQVLRVKALGDEIAENTPLAKLLQKPNDWQGADSFWEHLFGYKVLAGEFFVWANRNESDTLPPTELYVLPPQVVELVPDPNNVWGVLGYDLNLNGGKIRLRKEDVLHWKSFNPNFDASTREHMRGLSPFKAAWRDLQADNAATDADVALKTNRGAIGAIYPKQMAMLTEVQAGEFQERLKSKINGNDKAGSVAILQQEFGYLQLALSPSDLQLIESKRMNQEQICNVLGVPSILFNNDNSSYNNRITAVKELINLTIVPHWGQVRDALNMWLLPMFKETGYLDFDITNLPELADDLANLKTVYGDMWQITPNELRKLFGMDELPDPNMNKIYAPANVLPLEQVAEEVPTDMNNEMDGLTNRGLI